MPAIKVVLMSGPDDGLEVWLRSEDEKGSQAENGWRFAIGRGDENDLTVPFDTQVSRKHAVITVRDGRLVLDDLGSHNGTYIDDRKITAATPLQREQLLRVGRTWMMVAEVEA